MSRWTTEQSSFLSVLLDHVVGTQEIIDIRQDYCRLYDCLWSRQPGNRYFTGSKAEGLDLPGSNVDYMMDVNNHFQIKVVQTTDGEIETNCGNTFLLCTENTPVGFALLRLNQIHVHICCRCGNTPHLSQCFQNLDGLTYLSSNMLVESAHLRIKSIFAAFHVKFARQGLSVELNSEFPHTSSFPTGADHVPSIRCTFWPKCAIEWVQRPRHL